MTNFWPCLEIGSQLICKSPRALFLGGNEWRCGDLLNGRAPHICFPAYSSMCPTRIPPPLGALNGWKSLYLHSWDVHGLWIPQESPKCKGRSNFVECHRQKSDCLDLFQIASAGIKCQNLVVDLCLCTCGTSDTASELVKLSWRCFVWINVYRAGVFQLWAAIFPSEYHQYNCLTSRSAHFSFPIHLRVFRILCNQSTTLIIRWKCLVHQVRIGCNLSRRVNNLWKQICF